MREDPDHRVQVQVVAHIIAPSAFAALAKNAADPHAQKQAQDALEKAEGAIAAIVLHQRLTRHPLSGHASPAAARRLREATEAVTAAARAAALVADAEALAHFADRTLPADVEAARG